MEPESHGQNLNRGTSGQTPGRAVLFGEIAVELGFLSRENLAAVLSERQQSRPVTGIGESLVSRGLLSRPQMDRVLEEQALRLGSAHPRLLGHLLIEKGHASAHAVDRALLEQRSRRARGLKSLLGSILVEKGALTEADLAAALQEQENPAPAPAPEPSPAEVEDPGPATGMLGGFEILAPARTCFAGRAYKARLKGSSKHYLLKDLGVAGPVTPELLAAFNAAGRTVTALSHDGLVQVLDFGRDGDRFWTASEEWSGNRLDEVAPPSPRRALEIAAGLAEALAHLHGKGVMHGNLSPACVVLRPEGGVQLDGFGFHRLLKLAPQGILYSSPERLSDLSRADWRSDLWAAGAILLEMLSGKTPDPGPDPRSQAERDLPGDLNPDVAAICLKCLEPELEQRYQDAGELLRDLTGYLEGRAVGASGRRIARGSKPTAVRQKEEPAGLSGWLRRLLFPRGS